MSPDAAQTADQLITFITGVLAKQQKKRAVIAVSGGIDSAVALTLLARAIGAENITALLLPYGDQSTADGLLITQHVGLTEKQVKVINIKPIVDTTASVLKAPESETIRLGNLQARARMLCVYDTAKAKEALVCGTENKSEHYLGYFTRFGDAASDFEPISALYKTQVRELAEFLHLPKIFLEKPPSAGLWQGQTDEDEMGFTYDQADQILEQLIDGDKSPAEIVIAEIEPAVIQKVVTQVEKMKFKLEVPYEISL